MNKTLTFDEWYDSALASSEEDKARQAWNAATFNEREACAQVCEGKNPHPDHWSDDREFIQKAIVLECAAAIRARSTSSVKD